MSARDAILARLRASAPTTTATLPDVSGWFAAHRRDDRHPDAGDGRRRVVTEPDRVEPWIGARTEVRAVGGDHHHPHAAVSGGSLQRWQQQRVHLRGETVERCRAVQGDRAHRPRLGDQQGGFKNICHVVSTELAARSAPAR